MEKEFGKKYQCFYNIENLIEEIKKQDKILIITNNYGGKAVKELVETS